MNQRHTKPQHRYLRKLRYLIKVGALPATVGLHEVAVYHDDDCPIWGHRWCTCNADIKLTWSMPAAADN